MCHSFGILQAPRKTLQETTNTADQRAEMRNEAPRALGTQDPPHTNSVSFPGFSRA